MGKFINTLDLMGDRALTDAFIEGTLEEFRDDVLTDIPYNTFAGFSNLKYVNLPNVSIIREEAFSRCSAIKTLILSSETMCTSEQWVFSGTPINSGTGYIYVPRALVDSYKTATNWSTYANQFRALEDYTVDGTVTGELDESKI